MAFLEKIRQFYLQAVQPLLLLLLRKLIAFLAEIFSNHPNATGENYFQHFWFTAKMSLRLVFTAVALFIHGVFPFTFTRTASNQMAKMNAIMTARVNYIQELAKKNAEPTEQAE